jgi:hypothetical protein
MMEQAIEDRGGQYLVAQYLASVDEALVRGNDEAGTLMAAGHRPEEQG